MSHAQYSPVGYSYQADNYCLDCICDVVGTDGIVRNQCGCAECRLDRMALTRGIDREDERSFDTDNFPKSIPYHNDLHADCNPWTCYAHCAKCHEVINGVSKLYGPDICPVRDTYERLA